MATILCGIIYVHLHHTQGDSAFYAFTFLAKQFFKKAFLLFSFSALE